MDAPWPWGRRLEVVTNFALILAALAVVAIAVKGFSPSARPKEIPAAPGVGASLSVPGLDLSRTERTLLIAFDPDCRYCKSSASFYQRIEDEIRKQTGVGLILLLDARHGAEDVSKYPASLGLRGALAARASFKELGIRATPTLLLVRRGAVVGSWTGLLPAEAEQEVVAGLTGP